MRLLIFVIFILLTFSQSPESIAKESTTAPLIHEIYQQVDLRIANSPVFQKALAHQDLAVQKTALLGLGRIGGKAIINRVAPFLQHSNEVLRQYAALALGICGNKEAAHYLWQRLPKEDSLKVKKEIYLGLGNLGQNNLISKMMKRLSKETSSEAQGYLFQGLGIALTFHKELKDDFADLNYDLLLKKFAQQKVLSAQLGLFLYRVPNIENYLKHETLLNISKQTLTEEQSIYLSKLIFKATKKKHKANRALLAWLIEQTESTHLYLSLEATRNLGNLLHYPQTLIQLGKLHVSSNELLAHTALKVLATSDLKTDNVTKLLKKQLKNNNPAMVVEALTGLIKRQSKDDMSWVVKLFKHPSAFVKIQLISQLKAKSETEFNNVIKFLTQDPNKAVAKLAMESLTKTLEPVETVSETPSFNEALKASNQQVLFKTTVGNITLQMSEHAPYTSWNFIHNIKNGFYNNSYFSRVIGNFVAQGGDTIGNGEGSTNKTIREEINLLAHIPMTVGMATRGKDTGTSQFFINTGRNQHLDRNYTIFAHVIKGQEIVMNITNGARILDASVVNINH
ncbi:peptidylprolyl isomerase [Aliikangiella sp. IMCC44359]|uniref:peptidylprolyl isomerase n=1 Tax=Aliikangiella sp. IMCC44359 TaxID=3459125 RepID=UPI00403AEC18